MQTDEQTIRSRVSWCEFVEEQSTDPCRLCGYRTGLNYVLRRLVPEVPAFGICFVCLLKWIGLHIDIPELRDRCEFELELVKWGCWE